MEEDAAAKDGSLPGPGSTQDARALQHQDEDALLSALEPAADARVLVSVQRQPAGARAPGSASGRAGGAALSAAGAEQPCEEAAPGPAEPAAAPGDAADITVGKLAQRLRGSASQPRGADLQAELASAPEAAPVTARQSQPAEPSVPAQLSAAAPDRAAGPAASQADAGEAPHTQPTSLAASAAASLAEGAAQPDTGEAPHVQPTALAASAAASLAEGACEDVPAGTAQPSAGVNDAPLTSD